MKTIAIVCAMALFWSLPAFAQFELIKISVCKKIANDTDRLKCYDDVFSNTAAERPASEPKVPAEWVVTESRSPIDDSEQASASLEGSPAGSMLLFRCQEHKTEAVFLPGEFFF